jgi:hypothetical protein
MIPPIYLSVVRISEELGIYVVTLYSCRNVGLLQGEVMPASYKAQEFLSAAEKFTVVLEIPGLSAIGRNATSVLFGFGQNSSSV